jgi:hypothetical protein
MTHANDDNLRTLPHSVQTAPGWYPDPSNPTDSERYWDGDRWTDSVAPKGKVPPAGRYAGAEQAQTQRYWTGTQWTDERAPAAPDVPSWGAGVSNVVPLALGILGSLIAIIATFLPRVESDTFLRVSQNTLVQFGDGLIIIGLAVAAGIAAYVGRNKQGRNWPLVVPGVLIVSAAIYVGTGDRLELHSLNPVGGESVTDKASPGIGIYAAGIGGAIIVIAGFLDPRRYR